MNTKWSQHDERWQPMMLLEADSNPSKTLVENIENQVSIIACGWRVLALYSVTNSTSLSVYYIRLLFLHYL